MRFAPTREELDSNYRTEYWVEYNETTGTPRLAQLATFEEANNLLWEAGHSGWQLREHIWHRRHRHLESGLGEEDSDMSLSSEDTYSANGDTQPDLSFNLFSQEHPLIDNFHLLVPLETPSAGTPDIPLTEEQEESVYNPRFTATCA